MFDLSQVISSLKLKNQELLAERELLGDRCVSASGSESNGDKNEIDLEIHDSENSTVRNFQIRILSHMRKNKLKKNSNIMFILQIQPTKSNPKHMNSESHPGRENITLTNGIANK